MRKSAFVLILGFFSLLFTSCNSFYNVRVAHIEVLVPGKVILPDEYRSLAVRYNNTNEAFNRDMVWYFVDNKVQTEEENLDSMAAHIYYDFFLTTIKNQRFFDTVYNVAPADYSKTSIVDTLKIENLGMIDTTESPETYLGKTNSIAVSQHLKRFPARIKNDNVERYLDPDFALYTEEEIGNIADSTGADFLISLDHFFTRQSVKSRKNFSSSHMVTDTVAIYAFWTIYDLRDKYLRTNYLHNDFIAWYGDYDVPRQMLKVIPPRKDAVLNAADIQGSEFAHFLIPHWLQVERMYYNSESGELRKTKKLVKEGKWMEAASIWKSNVESRNKMISAMCMYNMAVVCEVEGKMEAAIDWAVKSYHVYGEDNRIHSKNCKDYIQILSRRKFDFRLLDKQVSSNEE